MRITPRFEAGKLQISGNGVDIKIEVNLVNRGCVKEPKELPLSEKTQASFEAFCVMPIVPIGQTFWRKNSGSIRSTASTWCEN